jgi:Uma2 family endonuclease
MGNGISTAVHPVGKIDTLADALHQLGDVPAERILWDPHPGTATEMDVVRYVDSADKRLVELVDGVLVEKAMSAYSGRIGGLILYFIEEFLNHNDLGVTYGADAALRILPDQVRLPDVSFVSWDRLPNRELPAESVAALIPDLAVEVLSPGNTIREMARKRLDYFAAGVKVVWQIDPESKSAEIYSAPEQFTRVNLDGHLDGGNVLPGFQLSLKQLFERAGRRRGEK